MLDGNALQQLPTIPPYTDLGNSLVLHPSEPLNLVATVPDTSKPSITWLRLALPARQPIAKRHEKPSQFAQFANRIPGAHAYTIRLSWPASSPAKVNLDTFSKGYGDAWLRVTIQDDSSAVISSSAAAREDKQIAYTLKLERAYLGFIPESSRSMLFVLCSVVGMLFAFNIPGKVFRVLLRAGADHSSKRE